MIRTYDAVLNGDHVDWTGEAPDTSGPVRVRVTVLYEPPGSERRGERMAAALRKLAASDAFADVADPVAWQREVRKDRALPGREG